MCQSYRDPLRDVSVIEADFFDIGWDSKNLRKIFSEFPQDIMDSLNDVSRGGFDVFLYKWTNKKFELSGGELANSEEENLIRYSYGWNKTKYGQLILSQNSVLNNFIELVIESTKNFLLDDLLSQLLRPGNVVNDYMSYDKIKNVIQKSYKYTQVDTVNNKLIIDYQKIVDLANFSLLYRIWN
jgi:hypothetical protein